MITSSRPCLHIGQGLSTSRFQWHVTFGCRLLLFISLPVAALQDPWGKWVCCLWASLHSCMHPQRSCGVGMPAGTGSCSWEMDFMVKKHPLVRVWGGARVALSPASPTTSFFMRADLREAETKIVEEVLQQSPVWAEKCLLKKQNRKNLHKWCLMGYYNICEHSQTLHSGTA